MVRLRREQVREEPIEWAGRSVVLTSTRTSVRVATPWLALEASYGRPTGVEMIGDGGTMRPFRDHVMLARFAVVALLLAAVGRRLLR